MRLRSLVLVMVHLALPAVACEMSRYTRVEAAPGVHVFQAAEGTTAVVNGNMIAIVGKESILVVDSGQFPGIAKRVAADIKAISPLPVKYVVNTHWHGDHMLGNTAFRDAWPGVKFVAHPHTIERGAFFYTDYAAKTGKSLPEAITDMRKQREGAKSEDEKLWIDRTLECAEWALGEVPSTHYLAPDTPLEGEMKVDLGGITAVVKHIGSGNTPGDLIVWVPERRLVATGDMVVAPVPYAIGSDLSPWTRTLAELRRLDPAIYVPGHGAVMRDDTYIRDVDKLLTSTHAQLTAMLARGVARADAAKELDTKEFRERYVTTPMRRQAFEQFFIRPAIFKLWPRPAPAPTAAPS